MWGLSLIIIFPLLIVFLGEISIALEKRYPYVAATVQIIRNLVLPSLAIFILLNKVLAISVDSTPVQIVQTIVGVCTIYHKPPANIKESERFPKFIEYLRTFPGFIHLEHRGLEKLVRDATLKYFGVGEIAIERETIQHNLYLILAGVAKISVLSNFGKEQKIARISHGELFGEMSLVSSNSGSVSVTAIDDLEVLVLKSETVQDILDNVPRLSREIGEVIETRRRAIRMAKKESN